MKTASVEVSPVTALIGAEIAGVDLADNLDDSVVAVIRDALRRWKVVFFRGQHLNHAGHVACARRFGVPVVLSKRGSASPPDVPEIETTADKLELAGQYGMEREEWLHRRRYSLLRDWHTDKSSRVDPPFATILRAETVPSYGGDTTWSNLAAAYAGLSAPVRALADGLRVEHRLGAGYLPRAGDDAFARHLLGGDRPGRPGPARLNADARPRRRGAALGAQASAATAVLCRRPRRRRLQLARHWPWTPVITTSFNRLQALPNPG